MREFVFERERVGSLAGSIFLLLNHILLIPLVPYSLHQRKTLRTCKYTFSQSLSRLHTHWHTLSLSFSSSCIHIRTARPEYTSWLQNELKILKPFPWMSRDGIDGNDDEDNDDDRPLLSCPTQNSSPPIFFTLNSSIELLHFSAMPKALLDDRYEWESETERKKERARGCGERVKNQKCIYMKRMYMQMVP